MKWQEMTLLIKLYKTKHLEYEFDSLKDSEDGKELSGYKYLNKLIRKGFVKKRGMYAVLTERGERYIKNKVLPAMKKTGVSLEMIV